MWVLEVTLNYNWPTKKNITTDLGRKKQMLSEDLSVSHLKSSDLDTEAYCILHTAYRHDFF